MLRASGALIGVVGFVPVLNALPQIEAFGARPPELRLTSAQLGLYWAIDPAHQGQGYATEAGRTLIVFAFDVLRVERIVATTDYTNLASQAVMKHLGMRLERNPFPDPPYLQIVGVLDHPAIAAGRAPKG